MGSWSNLLLKLGQDLEEGLEEGEEEKGEEPTFEKVVSFFVQNPNPEDADFHAWAESQGVEPDEAEDVAYRLATVASKFLAGGKANEKGMTVDKAPEEELKKGIGIEKEHIGDEMIQARIALDHIAEDPESPLSYYDMLDFGERFRKYLIGLSPEEAKAKIDAMQSLVSAKEAVKESQYDPYAALRSPAHSRALDYLIEQLETVPGQDPLERALSRQRRLDEMAEGKGPMEPWAKGLAVGTPASAALGAAGHFLAGKPGVAVGGLLGVLAGLETYRRQKRMREALQQHARAAFPALYTGPGVVLDVAKKVREQLEAA